MEMMIATAVLAGSGVALFALVGQASQLARKAEERTAALQMAQSTLDEFLAAGAQSESEAQTEGSFDSDPRWTYRIEQSDVEQSDFQGDGQTESRLKRIVVSIYRASEAAGPSSASTDSAIVNLVRWSRTTNSPSSSSSSEAPSPAEASESIPEALGVQ